jgi:F420-dependent oxidoreductase-like protein
MRIATALNYADDFRKTLERAQQLEAAGVDMIFIAEAYGFDAVSLLGALAATTTRITLASGILNTFSRTPTCLAQTAAGLDALSGGRFVLGLGASGPQVIEGFHGVPFEQPLRRADEIIEICRAVWQREPVNYQGKVFQVPLPAGRGSGLAKPLKIINHPLRARIPIYLATLTPKSVEHTARLADGWLPFLFAPDLAHRVWGEALARGRAKRAPELGALETVAGAVLAIGSGCEKQREVARGMAALYIGGMGARDKNFYNDLARAYGYVDEARQIQDLYLSGKKGEAAAAVPASLLEKTSLCGERSYVKERLAAYREAGVTILNVSPVGGDLARQIGELRELLA